MRSKIWYRIQIMIELCLRSTNCSLKRSQSDCYVLRTKFQSIMETSNTLLDLTLVHIEWHAKLFLETETYRRRRNDLHQKASCLRVINNSMLKQANHRLPRNLKAKKPHKKVQARQRRQRAHLLEVRVLFLTFKTAFKSHPKMILPLSRAIKPRAKKAWILQSWKRLLPR